MTKTFAAVLLVAGIGAGTLALPAAEARKPAGNAWQARVADRMLAELVAVSGVPGGGAAVWSGGTVVWRGSAGYRDLERKTPVTGKTVFRLASVSKLLAVTAAAKLADEGKLDLDAPVADQLPWLRNAWPAITARQLAAHTSGLPHYQDQDANRGQTHYPTGRDAVGVFAGRPLLTAPGEAYAYSSWGYTLLGALVEEASGRPFPDYVTSRITPGLAVMRDATDSGHPHAASAYEWVGGKLERAKPHDFSYTWAGGGMAASPEGIVRFGGAMLENRIVSRATFDRMLVPMTLNNGKPAGEAAFTVGFGWRNGVDSLGQPIAYHNGAAIGARSALVLWRKEQVAASLLTNLMWTSSIEQSAAMLAAPFRSGTPGTVTTCPIKVGSFRGTLGTAAIAGTASFTQDQGLCIGTLALDGAFADYFKGAVQSRRDAVRIVAINGQGGLSRAGLVTPYGIYDLRPQDDGTLVARFSATRELRITLQP